MSMSSEGIQTGRYSAGVQAVLESYLRRLTTPRGTLLGGDEEENFGIDLPGYVGDTDPSLLEQVTPGVVRNELRKDPRTFDVSVSVVASSLRADGLVELAIRVQARLQETGETFDSVFNVSELSVSNTGGIAV